MAQEPPITEAKAPDKASDLVRAAAKGPGPIAAVSDGGPELSPAVEAGAYSSILAAGREGGGAGRSTLVDQLQRGYGNDYVEVVLSGMAPGEQVAEEATSDSSEAEAPKKEAPAPEPEPEPETASEEAPEAAPAPEASDSGTAPGEGGEAAPAPDVAAPEGALGEEAATEESAAAAAAESAPGSSADPGGAAPSEAEMEAAEKDAEGGAEEAPAEGEAKEGEAKKEEGGGEELPAEQKAPASPAEDPAFQAVVGRARAVAHEQGHNSPAEQKAAEAQAAAPAPENDLTSQAAGAQVDKMDQQEQAPFDREGFKQALLDKIASIAPKNLKEADNFKKDNKAASIKGAVVSKVESGKEKAQGPIATTTKAEPDPGAATPKEIVPQPPTEPGAAPGGIGADKAAPKPKTEAEVSLDAGSKSLDQELEDNEVTEEQLQQSNEPEFTGAVASKKEAQVDAVERPVAYRQAETEIVAGAEAGAVGGAANDIGGMHGVRGVQFEAIGGDQAETQTADQKKRAEVGQHIEKLYQETKAKVEEHLKQLDTDVGQCFDNGASAAAKSFEDYVGERMRKYKKKRYSGITGKLKWGKDKLFGMPKDVDEFYVEGRELYIKLMGEVIDDVATLVETGLNDAMKLIAEGRKAVQDYVTGLPDDLQSVGEEAAADIQSRFDELKSKVDAKRDQLIDSLAQKYTDNLKKIDARIEEMKAANKGLVDKAIGAIKGVIKAILELKDMLLGVLARAAGVIGQIIKNPIKFIGNLVQGVGMGLKNFMANIGTHLQKGLMGWLFGTLAKAGIEMPETFDLKGILSLVLQILGLTYANIRARAVKILGEEMVSRLEQVAEIFKILITEGPSGLWNYIKDKLGDLKTMVLDGIKNFVIERIVIAGITWIVSLLNPASAFIKACKAIYDIIMFFVTRGSQILALVNSIIDSLAAIVSGSLGAAAAAVENALARALPVAISFLASLLGLGGISEKIKSILMRIQAPVNKAIDWVINKAVALVKSAGKLLGIGKGDEDEKVGEDADHDKIAAKAVAELETPEGDQSDYAEVRAKMMAKAKTVETTYTGLLQKGIGLKVVFGTPEKDEGDGEVNFDVVIAPNTTRRSGARKLEAQLALAKSSLGVSFTRQQLEGVIGTETRTTQSRLNKWRTDGDVFFYTEATTGTTAAYTFDKGKEGTKALSDNISNRSKYGYNNPRWSDGNGMQILSKGFSASIPPPTAAQKKDSVFHDTIARYDSQWPGSGAKNLKRAQVILGHGMKKLDGSFDYNGCSDHFNQIGHTLPKSENGVWCRAPSSYWGPEDATESAGSGGDPYEPPGPHKGSHPDHY